MFNFKPFAAAFAKQWDSMSANEMYRVDVGGDALWENYLASFPEGTNPIFRVRTEHDGSYDKSVVRRIGNVVTIKNGELTSVWDIPGLEYPYDVVAASMAKMVKAGLVNSLFRINEHKLGHIETYETDKETGKTLTWNHFHAAIAKRHYSNTVEQTIGEPNTTAQMFKRGLETLSPEAFEIALDLIDSKSVYRGEEFRKNLVEFSKVQRAYLEMNERDRNTYIWNNIAFPYARLRNTAVGTLLIDLTEGKKSIEDAVHAYGHKMDGYKRPTAIITQGMVKQAMEKINELDLEPSLERRHAKLSDVNVNDVLWVSNAAQAKMKGGLESLLAGEVARPKVNEDAAEDISIADFMGQILPHARTLDVLFKNKLQKNLASITAPVHADITPLFKWDNSFAWSYKGNIADSAMRQAVVSRGGSVTGVFRFTHQWNYGKRNASLMDLHVFMPGWNGHGSEQCHDNYGNQQRVGWNNRTHHKSGGVQDVDYVNAAEPGYVPVENITFPDLNRMPDGDYECKIHNWQLRNPTEGGFKAEIEFGGTIYEYEVDRPLKAKEWVHVATVTKRGETFSIQHHLPCGQAAQEVWGLKTEGFVPVSTVMLSPNYWGESETGNKHWFFLLDGCLNDEPTRGIYNEFLRNDLSQYGKVFEVLGAKTKCPVADEQLSGLGFSSTKSDSVIVRVGGQKFNKLFNIQF
jgi:hypothetical protein